MKKSQKRSNTFFKVAFLFLIFFSAFIRFINYENRWGLAYDQAYDSIVAHYAYDNNKLPLLGRFSSAGPFQTGGEWFWIIMAGISLNPDYILSPWIFLTLIYILFVIFIILFGVELVDKKFALILGIITSVSTAQIAQGTNLTNQSPQAIFSLLALWFSVKFIRKREVKYIFLLSLCVGIASSIHLQGTALLILVIITLLISKNITPKILIITLFGLIIPWIPVLIVELQNNFFNTKSMIKYYLHDQYNISLDVLGRRWLTYLGVFWPSSWALVTGGLPFITYIFPFSILFLIYKKRKKGLPREWIIIVLTFSLVVILLRYIRTPLFDSYLVFLHPFLLVITAGLIFSFYKINKLLGMLFFSVIVIGSLIRSYSEITKASNLTYKRILTLESKLLEEYRTAKFEVYDYKYKVSSTSLPFVLSLYINKKLEDNGTKIGLINCEEKEGQAFKTIVNIEGTCILNLDDDSSLELTNRGWVNTNPSVVYRETQEWYKNEN